MLRSLIHRALEWADRFRPARVRAFVKRCVHRAGLLPTYWRIREAALRWRHRLRPTTIRRTVRWLLDQRAAVRNRRREPRLTVAVDVTAFWEPLTGIGWYLYRLLEHLADRDDVRLRLYGPNLIDTPDLPQPVAELPRGPALEPVTYRVPQDLSLSWVWLVGRMRARQERLIAADENQILFAPNYFLPPWFDGARGRLVATVHDLAFRRVPETMREETRRDLAEKLESVLERATRVLTDAETVRQELLETGLVDAARVSAVHLGPGPVAASDSDGELPVGTPEGFVLHVGTLEPRKNLPVLLEAWGQLRDRGERPPPIVLCGRYGWKTEGLRERIEAAAAEGWLYHFGYLENGQVGALYRRARLVVLPSVYEGFGLPAVEAMCVGAPLLVSDIPVLREVCGEAAVFVDPQDPEAWAAAASDLLRDSARLEDLGRAGLQHGRRFDWKRTAEETAAVWHAAADDRGHARGDR